MEAMIKELKQNWKKILILKILQEYLQNLNTSQSWQLQSCKGTCTELSDLLFKTLMLESLQEDLKKTWRLHKLGSCNLLVFEDFEIEYTKFRVEGMGIYFRKGDRIFGGTSRGFMEGSTEFFPSKKEVLPSCRAFLDFKCFWI